jgi:DegV family protein with EDD domain
MYEKNKISVLPFNITLGDNIVPDDENLTNQNLFDFFKETKTLPKTSALNSYDYEEFFKKENTEDEGIIHFCISSKVSSTYNNAVLASKEFKNVYVIDSLSLSSGIGLQVLYACKLRDKGVPIAEAVELINNRRSAVQISFMVDTLTYLHKGGRCSALALLGANVLGIRPSIKLENGKMNVGKKYVGKMHKILDKYVLDTLEEFNTPDNDLCFITYSSATDEMKDLVKATLKDHASFKKVKETIAGATVATHCGPNTLGIIYYNDGK